MTKEATPVTFITVNGRKYVDVQDLVGWLRKMALRNGEPQLLRELQLEIAQLVEDAASHARSGE